MTTAQAQKHISSPREVKAIASTSITKTPALPAQINAIQMLTNRISSIVAVTIIRIIASITAMAKRKAQAKA